MSVKEAVQILLTMRDGGTTLKEKYDTAIDMAVAALELQGGNLFVDDLSRTLHIGTVNGNVYC